jgi:asparagine synthase (glutamine-hydrolysing)
MCGIVGGYAAPEIVAAGQQALVHRGPDGQGLVTHGRLSLAHVRLAVMDPTPASAQPFVYGSTTLVYNGELWNFSALRDSLIAAGSTFVTSGDTEVLAALLDRDGLAGLSRIDAMTALAWTTAGDSQQLVHLARDPYGEVPLHYGYTRAGEFIFASEIKALIAMNVQPGTVRWVAPGAILSASPEGTLTSTRYAPPHDLSPSADSLEQGAPVVRRHLARAMEQRSMSDVGATALISGGLDSSAVLALLKLHHPDVVAYTAVHDRRSLDLRMARLVCDHLGVKLVEVDVAAPTADDLADVVRRIEMPHKAQVEIGWPCLALARRLQEDGAKVTFTGEGSDELYASYARSYHRVQLYGWHLARWRDFIDQQRKNFARVNKVFMACGVEARMPFLDPGLVRYSLRLTRDAVFDYAPTRGKHERRVKEKGVLRKAFADVLPAPVIERDKLAFQTGAGIPDAAAAVVADPTAFYRSEFLSAFHGVKS